MFEPRPAASPRRAQPVVMGLRAWPFWCDSLGHVNNASYLSIAALGRVRWLLRCGMLGAAVARRHTFLIAGTQLLYRREIPLLSRFSLHTELVATDERFLTFRSLFTLPHEGGDRHATHVLARLALRRREGGLLDPGALLAERRIVLSESADRAGDLAAWERSQAEALRYLEPEA